MPFEIVRNDITKMKVDAIVNAANSSLLGGGGVDGAIHSAAGPELLEECRSLGGCPTGEARITKGYRLPARYVIHTVGPVWQGGEEGEPELLASCYTESLKLAAQYRCSTVAFPMISTGIYGYPKGKALAVAMKVISGFLMEHDMMIYLVVFGREALTEGMKLVGDIRSYIDDTYVEQHLDSDPRRFLSGLFPRRKEKRAASESRWNYGDGRPGQEIQNLPNIPPTKEADRPSAPRERAAVKPGAPAPALYERAAAPVRDERRDEAVCGAAPAEEPDWEELLRRTDEGFSQALLRLIDERGMTDVQCYKKANVDRKLFSKIRTNPGYRPGKMTVLAFALALRLSLPETRELLEKAGFALSHSSKPDLVVEYCIDHGMYDVLEINEVLFELDLPLLGSGGAA